MEKISSTEDKKKNSDWNYIGKCNKQGNFYLRLIPGA